MKIDDYLAGGGTVRIGQWWTECCERDMEQICSDEDIDRAKNAFLPGARIWNTELDALRDLMPEREGMSADSIDYWDDLLADAARRSLEGAAIDRCEPPNAI